MFLQTYIICICKNYNLIIMHTRESVTQGNISLQIMARTTRKLLTFKHMSIYIICMCGNIYMQTGT